MPFKVMLFIVLIINYLLAFGLFVFCTNLTNIKKLFIFVTRKKNREIMGNQDKTMGLIIKGFREKYDYTQDKLANFLGIKREMISFYENGEREVPIEVLEKLSDLFGVELEMFFVDDIEEAMAGVAFAYRKDELNTEDMQQIAAFGKIVKNYLKIKKLHERTK
ncbi:MAG: helix-turn-helix transcriptional regulator [Bacteroidota bacterium]